jgi:Golgi SNAP receptor complex protein 1
MKSANSVIGQAALVRSELRDQGASLSGVSGTITRKNSGQVPGLNGFIDVIRKKRQRDDCIVGGIVAGCILFTLWYLFG